MKPLFFSRYIVENWVRKKIETLKNRDTYISQANQKIYIVEMKDSIWSIPYCYEFIAEEEERATKKQKVYDHILGQNGSLLEKVKIMPTHDAFNFLRDCKCCFTHQINKPRVLVMWTDRFGGLKPPEDQREKECKCYCRQLSRIMCRGINLKDVK